MAIIYKITSPDRKIYIGSTLDVKMRWKTYYSCRMSNQPKLYASVIKYGVKNHNFEVIAECNDIDRFRYEKVFILLYGSVGKHGLNCNLPTENDYIKRNTKQKIKFKLTHKNFKDGVLYRLSNYQKKEVWKIVARHSVDPTAFLQQAVEDYHHHNFIDLFKP